MTLRSKLYRGFSSAQFAQKRSFRIYDTACVETDLLNHIFTRRGERVMMPTFGTIIPDLAFEPMDDATLSILREELLNVINFDPRVSLISLKMNPNYDEGKVDVYVSLFYIELNVQNQINFNISFDQIA